MCLDSDEIPRPGPVTGARPLARGRRDRGAAATAGQGAGVTVPDCHRDGTVADRGLHRWMSCQLEVRAGLRVRLDSVSGTVTGVQSRNTRAGFRAVLNF